MPDPATFMGIVRPDGRVATRNYIGVLTSVNCSATARGRSPTTSAATSGRSLADYPNVDGVVALTHGMGCATDSDGEELRVLRRTLGGYARHANFAACWWSAWAARPTRSRADRAGGPARRRQAADLQHPGHRRHGEDRGPRHGAGRGDAAEANRVKRQPVPARHLTVGLQCGGSDGYSGISANPALGAAVDRLVRHGGTAILSETPEIYGGEHLLTRRAVSPRWRQAAGAHRWWEAYTARNGMAMDNNPSPATRPAG
jgi:altronate hydrolase